MNALAGGDVALVKALAKLLDEAVTIPVINRKVGLDALLGLIPGIGDIGSSAIGGYILLTASKLGVPPVVMWRMLLNLGIDAAVGVVPFVGDFLDAAYKSNTKNAKLLAQALAEPQKTKRASRWALAGLALGFIAITAASIAGAVLLVRWLAG